MNFYHQFKIVAFIASSDNCRVGVVSTNVWILFLELQRSFSLTKCIYIIYWNNLFSVQIARQFKSEPFTMILRRIIDFPCLIISIFELRTTLAVKGCFRTQFEKWDRDRFPCSPACLQSSPRGVVEKRTDCTSHPLSSSSTLLARHSTSGEFLKIFE